MCTNISYAYIGVHDLSLQVGCGLGVWPHMAFNHGTPLIDCFDNTTNFSNHFPYGKCMMAEWIGSFI